MAETEGLSKDLSVGFGNNSYKAVSESAVLNVVKPLLKKHGLILFPINVEVENWKDEFTTRNGDSARLVTQIKATYKIVDTDTGESELLQTVGHGVDTQDKASGKAMTYAYKALLQKTFMMFSGEDTDNEHSDAITDRQVKPKTISEAQAKRLFAIAKANNISTEQMKKDLDHIGVAKTTDLSPEQYNKLIKTYESKK